MIHDLLVEAGFTDIVENSDGTYNAVKDGFKYINICLSPTQNQGAINCSTVADAFVATTINVTMATAPTIVPRNIFCPDTNKNQVVEYQNHVLASTDAGLLADLNKLGAEGWILCSALRETSSHGWRQGSQLTALFYRAVTVI